MADAITVKNILDAEVGPSRKLSDDHITPRKSLRRSSSAARCDGCRFGSERLLGLAALPIWERDGAQGTCCRSTGIAVGTSAPP